MGGRPRSFSTRSSYDNDEAAKEHMSGESTNHSLMQETFMVAGLERANPSKHAEVNSMILRGLPIIQEGDNVDMGGEANVQNGKSLRVESCPNFKGDDVEQPGELMGQPAGSVLIDVAASKTDKEWLGVKSTGLDHAGIKAGTDNTKSKSTWTRLNCMDFGLGGLSKALQLPTCGKRSSEQYREEEQQEDFDDRESKRGKIGGGKDVDNIISAGVESHPCQEQ
nr:hypothetical protein CFP56_66185 [Quercus suber]